MVDGHSSRTGEPYRHRRQVGVYEERVIVLWQAVVVEGQGWMLNENLARRRRCRRRVASQA